MLPSSFCRFGTVSLCVGLDFPHQVKQCRIIFWTTCRTTPISVRIIGSNIWRRKKCLSRITVHIGESWHISKSCKEVHRLELHTRKASPAIKLPAGILFYLVLHAVLIIMASVPVMGQARPGDQYPLIDVHPSYDREIIRPEGFTPREIGRAHV